MKIIDARIEDAQTIANFQIAMAKETENYKLDRQKITKGVIAVLKDKYKGRYFVAQSDKSEIIASLLITYEWSDWRNSRVWWIQSVYVVPEFRRKGIFSMMYKHIMSLVISDDTVSGIRLYVEKDNSKAMKTYKSVGMDGEHYKLFEWMKF